MKSKTAELPTGVATGRVSPTRRPIELDRLEEFIGRWLTEGETVAANGVPAVRILASDVYQWAPGGHFILHPAYGRIGDVDVGGIEIIGFDAATKQYQTHFFDSFGNVSTQMLSHRDGVWMWEGPHARCRGELSDDGKIMVAHHERSDDGVNWVPSMTVTLTKVG